MDVFFSEAIRLVAEGLKAIMGTSARRRGCAEMKVVSEGPESRDDRGVLP
jgi:hypothetical protein